MTSFSDHSEAAWRHEGKAEELLKGANRDNGWAEQGIGHALLATSHRLAMVVEILDDVARELKR